MSYQFLNSSVSSTGIKAYIWTFGDGSASADINAAHTFKTAGIYTVCLNIESKNGCKSSYCAQLQVIDSGNLCNIISRYESYKDTLDCKKIHFVNHSVSASSTIHYTWNFGDGSTSHDINPSHIYNQPGQYRVCLVSEADSICRKEYCDTVMVNCDTYCNITARYEHYKDTLDCKKIHFINQAVSANSSIHFTWNFGDGSSSHDINPTHIYSQSGKYNVCLVSEAGSNCRKEYCDSVTVVCSTCKLNANFAAHHDAAHWNTIHFDNLSNPVSSIQQTYWSYGDGDSSRDFNTFHTYSKPGVYNVCLKVISLEGCTSKYCASIEVIKTDSCIIKANFSHYGSPGNSLFVKFEALYLTVANTAEYHWNFGDSSTGSGRIAFHIFDKPWIIL